MKTWYRFKYKRGNGWNVGPNKTDAVDFRVSKRIEVLGFLQYGPLERSDFGITFKLALNDNFKPEEKQEFKADQPFEYNETRIVEVKFKQPIQVEPDQKATLAVSVHKSKGGFFCGDNSN